VPNNFVDLVSGKLLACYPRRTFYPLSDIFATQQYRVTMTDFLVFQLLISV
jgi:hypothetical protein